MSANKDLTKSMFERFNAMDADGFRHWSVMA